MNTHLLAMLLDGGLIGLAGLTLALILWKSVELYSPRAVGRTSDPRSLAGEAELDELLEQLERLMPSLASIASTAPFVGLAATVLHIMEALSKLSTQDAEVWVLAGPLSTALHSTLLGLASAVPAAAAYNLFVRRLQLIENRARRHWASAPRRSGV